MIRSQGRYRTRRQDTTWRMMGPETTTGYAHEGKNHE